MSETVPKGETVDLVVASGQVELKDYVGQDISEVRSELYDLNLEVVEQPEESQATPGTILSQNPAAGKVEQGTEVTFVIAEEPASTVTAPPTTETVEPTESETSETEEPEPTSTDTGSETSTPSEDTSSPTGPDTGSSPRSTGSPPSP